MNRLTASLLAASLLAGCASAPREKNQAEALANAGMRPGEVLLDAHRTHYRKGWTNGWMFFLATEKGERLSGLCVFRARLVGSNDEGKIEVWGDERDGEDGRIAFESMEDSVQDCRARAGMKTFYVQGDVVRYWPALSRVMSMPMILARAAEDPECRKLGMLRSPESLALYVAEKQFRDDIILRFHLPEGSKIDGLSSADMLNVGYALDGKGELSLKYAYCEVDIGM